MILKHGWIITRGAHSIPQSFVGQMLTRLRNADDLTNVTIFEDQEAAEVALKRCHAGAEYAVRRTKVTMEVLDV